jgi:hypothetical protein
MRRLLNSAPRLAQRLLRTLLAAVTLASSIGAAADRVLNRALAHQPQGRWVQIHAQQPGDAVTFRRQAHAGSAFDTKRGRIILFGSDTHGDDWTNSPLYFDVGSSIWTQAYPNDDSATYRVTNKGMPVAGPAAAPRPWAMHTFAAVTYDERYDRVIVASYPQHLEPGRFTDAMAAVWPRIVRHPTWSFDLTTERWQSLRSPAVHFFAYATAYDLHRGVVIGYRPDGIYELSAHQKTPRWRYVAPASHRAYHTNIVYDSWRRRFMIAGSHRMTNDVIVYDPRARKERLMPTAGVRPPPFQHAPMAFHSGKGVLVVLVDEVPHSERGITVTWTYDPDVDSWNRLDGATLQGPLGMNYNLHYDSAYDVLLLVRDAAEGSGTSVWALKL